MNSCLIECIEVEIFIYRVAIYNRVAQLNILFLKVFVHPVAGWKIILSSLLAFGTLISIVSSDLVSPILSESK